MARADAVLTATMVPRPHQPFFIAVSSRFALRVRAAEEFAEGGFSPDEADAITDDG
jgi:hypothetical protein